MKHENSSWKTLLKWKKNDLWLCGSSILSVILIWIYLFFNESFDNILTYSNAEQYMYVAKHSYSTSYYDGKVNSELLKKNARILPLTPLCIYLLHFLVFGNWTLAACLYILITVFLASFFFCRFLLVFKISTSHSMNYAITLLIHPISYVTYRSVVNSDSLYLIFMFIALISVRISSYKVVLIATFLAILTNNQGIVLFLSIYCYLLFENQKYHKWITSFLMLFPIAFIFLGIIHYFYMNSFFAYFLQEYVYSNEYCPFVAIFLSCFEVDKLWAFHGNFMYYLIGYIAVIFLSTKSVMLSIHLVVSFIYYILIMYKYTFHHGIQFELFVILGFEEFFSNKNVRAILPIFSIVYAIVGHFVAIRSIDYS